MNVAPLLLHVCLLNLTCPEQEPLILCGGGGKHPPHSSIPHGVRSERFPRIRWRLFPAKLDWNSDSRRSSTTLRASAPFRCSICLGLGTSSIIIIHRRHQRVWGASYGYGWIHGCMDDGGGDEDEDFVVGGNWWRSCITSLLLLHRYILLLLFLLIRSRRPSKVQHTHVSNSLCKGFKF